jgi:hypothetical protein
MQKFTINTTVQQQGAKKSKVILLKSCPHA